MNIIKSIVHFFDKLEDYVRGALSHRPIIYTFIGGIGIVLFWKGVWETAEQFPVLYGPGSIIVSVIILLMTGLFVSFFIGDTILISGIRSQRKLAEKTEKEIVSEESDVQKIFKKIEKIEFDIKEIKNTISPDKKK